jgi:hypothetical protein
MPTVSRALAVATFRAAFLNALDQSAVAVFAGAPGLGRDPGASDADLSALFATLDPHVERLAQRFGVELDDSGDGMISTDPLQLAGPELPREALAAMLWEAFDAYGDRAGQLEPERGRTELSTMEQVFAWVCRVGLDPTAVEGMAGAMPRDDARAEIMQAS